MKAILVVDISTCEECPCYHEDRAVCQAGGLYGKPCPLRPLPSFKAVDLNDTRDVMMFCHGWNTCLAETTGETE